MSIYFKRLKFGFLCRLKFGFLCRFLCRVGKSFFAHQQLKKKVQKLPVSSIPLFEVSKIIFKCKRKTFIMMTRKTALSLLMGASFLMSGTATTVMAADGAALAKDKCESCHGENGNSEKKVPSIVYKKLMLLLLKRAKGFSESAKSATLMRVLIQKMMQVSYPDNLCPILKLRLSSSSAKIGSHIPGKC